MSSFAFVEVLSEVLEQRAREAGVPAAACNGNTKCPGCTFDTRGHALVGAVAPAEDDAGKALQAEHKANMSAKYADADEAERQEILEVEETLREVLARIEAIKKEKGID